jgi:hypothetical protein
MGCGEVRNKERVNRERANGMRMTRMTQIIADKTQKVQRQSASSAFYPDVHPKNL